MIVEYLAFPTDKFPCFGFVVCTEKGKQYLPEYNEKDIVYNLEETRFETMYLQKYDGKYQIKIGDKKTYVYRFLDDDKFIIGTIEDIRTQLIQALDKIQDAPFSKLELAEFLKVDECHIDVIKKDCYKFLKDFDEEYAEQWKKDNPFDEEYAEQVAWINMFSNRTQTPRIWEKENNKCISNTKKKNPIVRHVFVPHKKKQYALKINLDKISMSEKQNKTIIVRLYVNNKRYTKKKHAILDVVVSHIEKEYGLKLNPNKILILKKQIKAFFDKLNRKKRNSECRRHRRYQSNK